MSGKTQMSLVVMIGAALTVGVAQAVGAPMGDATTLVTVAGGAAAIVGVVGAALLWFGRSWSVRTQVALVALTTVGATAAGATAAAREMFLSGHDFGALLVVLAAAGTVGLAASLALGARVMTGSRTLAELARRIGDEAVSGAGSGDETRRVSPGDLGSVAVELADARSRLEEARERERSLEASRRELVAWVSHDLRTPLAGLRAMAEALEDGVVTDAPTVARYHRTMRSEVDRLSGLVDDLFELSRIQSGTLRLDLERASLADVVSDALAGAAPVAEAKGVRLSGRLDGVVPEAHLATAEVLRVLRNLLDNAIRHTPAAGEVRLELSVVDGHAEVSVSDGCGGIAEHDIDRVFDLAFRGDAARSPADGGAGLGLAIARGIVEAHAGDIDVHNTDEGCRFTVRLPLALAS